MPHDHFVQKGCKCILDIRLLLHENSRKKSVILYKCTFPKEPWMTSLQTSNLFPSMCSKTKAQHGQDRPRKDACPGKEVSQAVFGSNLKDL